MLRLCETDARLIRNKAGHLMNRTIVMTLAVVVTFGSILLADNIKLE
jgi:hypothetical protein